MDQERNDYTGPLQDKIDLSEFSKEFLLKLMRQWSALYEGILNNIIKVGSQTEGVGHDKATDIVLTSMEQIVPPVMRQIADLCKVDINTIEGRLKTTRFIPDNLSDHYTGGHFEILSDTEATMTYDGCYLVDQNLIGGDASQLRHFCEVIEPRAAMMYMNYPGERKLTSKMLKVPETTPPKPGEPYCIWHFKLED